MLVNCFAGWTGIVGQGLIPKPARKTGKRSTSTSIRRFWWTGSPACCGSAELLQKNAGYKVRVEGHTDSIGNDSYNDKLGLARANTVRDFLVKYGARANQIERLARQSWRPSMPVRTRTTPDRRSALDEPPRRC